MASRFPVDTDGWRGWIGVTRKEGREEEDNLGPLCGCEWFNTACRVLLKYRWGYVYFVRSMFVLTPHHPSYSGGCRA